MSSRFYASIILVPLSGVFMYGILTCLPRTSFSTVNFIRHFTRSLANMADEKDFSAAFITCPNKEEAENLAG